MDIGTKVLQYVRRDQISETADVPVERIARLCCSEIESTRVVFLEFGKSLSSDWQNPLQVPGSKCRRY